MNNYLDKLDLLERIDEARANRVSPEQFKQMWGYTIEEYVEKMLKFVAEQEA